MSDDVISIHHHLQTAKEHFAVFSAEYFVHITVEPDFYSGIADVALLEDKLGIKLLLKNCPIQENFGHCKTSKQYKTNA